MEQLQAKLLELFNNTHLNYTSRIPLKNLYKHLIYEEYNELMEEDSGTPEDFKELCDLIWVCIQYANACGYNLPKGMQALVREYESKFLNGKGEYEPLFREDGKLLKNKGFKKADFSKLL